MPHALGSHCMHFGCEWKALFQLILTRTFGASSGIFSMHFFGEESAEKGLNFYVVSNGFCVSVPPNINFTFNSIQFYHISFYSVHTEHTTFKCKVDFWQRIASASVREGEGVNVFFLLVRPHFQLCITFWSMELVFFKSISNNFHFSRTFLSLTYYVYVWYTSMWISVRANCTIDIFNLLK